MRVSIIVEKYVTLSNPANKRSLQHPSSTYPTKTQQSKNPCLFVPTIRYLDTDPSLTLNTKRQTPN
eukprot:scaffold12186_cov287-Chaetoceros_neogracile.AAC.2